MSHPRPVCSRFECIALLLQGGGALGAYQAGVYQALSEARLQPDWVAGISIGAINAALIAGNAPENRVARLRQTPRWTFTGLFGLLGPRQWPRISQWRSDRPRKRLTDTVPRVRLLVRPYGTR
jgi:NTE family protein